MNTSEIRYSPHESTPPYHEVADAFRDFIVLHPRGGYPRIGIPTHPDNRTKAEKVLKNPDTYHGETSFSPIQRKYVVMAMSYLTQNLQGAEDRIVESFLSDDSQRQFTRALEATALDTFTRFHDTTPQLMPALKAVIDLAGSIGIMIAISDAQNLLKFTHQNKQNEIDKIISPPDSYFIQMHDMSNPQYEVRCSGQRFAYTFLEKAGKAAKLLATHPELKGYTGDTEPRVDYINQKLLTHIDKLSVHAAQHGWLRREEATF